MLDKDVKSDRGRYAPYLSENSTGNEELRAALEDSGVEILSVETFETSDTDFSQQLTNVMATAADDGFSDNFRQLLF